MQFICQSDAHKFSYYSNSSVFFQSIFFPPMSKTNLRPCFCIGSFSRIMTQNMWRNLHKKRLCKEKLWKEEWSKIPLSVFSNLVKCYRRRLSSVLLAKGGLYEVLTSGVPINVAHMISCKKKNVSLFFTLWFYIV